MGEKKILGNLDGAEWTTPKRLALRYGVERATIYDWKYRPENYTFPPTMLNKHGRNLYIHVPTFENWFLKK